MDHLFSQLVFWHWFALALLLAISDVVLGANFFFVWCGFAALITGICKLLIPSLLWEYQFLIFGLAGMASLILWRQYIKTHRHSPTSVPHLNRRSAQYIGRVFTLEEPIVNGSGKVRVEDTIWRVMGNEDLPAGTKVRVVEANGVVLKVEKQED